MDETRKFFKSYHSAVKSALGISDDSLDEQVMEMFDKDNRELDADNLKRDMGIL